MFTEGMPWDIILVFLILGYLIGASRAKKQRDER